MPDLNRSMRFPYRWSGSLPVLSTMVEPSVLLETTYTDYEFNSRGDWVKRGNRPDIQPQEHSMAAHKELVLSVHSAGWRRSTGIAHLVERQRSWNPFNHRNRRFAIVCAEMELDLCSFL